MYGAESSLFASHSGIDGTDEALLSRISFNVTLAIVGIFATVAAASPNFTALAIFAALWSVGVSQFSIRF